MTSAAGAETWTSASCVAALVCVPLLQLATTKQTSAAMVQRQESPAKPFNVRLLKLLMAHASSQMH